MQVFDASSIIYAWDNYPIEQFPPLWDWMSEQVDVRSIVMPNIALKQVDNKVPECGTWLRKGNIELLPVTNNITQEALKIKRLLGIVSDNYHNKGVDENDIFIIATVRVNNLILISEEQQANKPNVLSKCKIPTVCAMKEVSVPCKKFIDFIKGSNTVFG
ncbi:MAG: DUF4411 family protein [Candidatus Omnitrophica bacterium]|nr:DUF4411 family protein [Candidatus Omnitrophota bacterium]